MLLSPGDFQRWNILSAYQRIVLLSVAIASQVSRMSRACALYTNARPFLLTFLRIKGSHGQAALRDSRQFSKGVGDSEASLPHTPPKKMGESFCMPWHQIGGMRTYSSNINALPAKFASLTVDKVVSPILQLILQRIWQSPNPNT